MQKQLCCSLLAILVSAGSLWSATLEQRRQYLDHLQQILPPVQSFTNWLEKTRELPPDFDALPRLNSLPDPLTFADGKRKVKTPQDWNERRAEIIQLYERYDIGTIPPKPKLDKIVPVGSRHRGRRRQTGFRRRRTRRRTGAGIGHEHR